MIARATYPVPNWSDDGFEDYRRKEAEFRALVKPFERECKTCGGYGEYETGHGPAGCGLCNSRLVPLRLSTGEAVDLDYGDSVLIIDGKCLNYEKHDANICA